MDFQTLRRAELPTDVQQQYPEATGGVACVSRYLKSGRGAEVYDGLKEGIPYGASIGYRALDVARETRPDGRKARRIKELALYEISTTLPGHAMNAATRTRLGVKVLEALEEFKAGWRHGSHADLTALRQMAAILAELIPDTIRLIEPAPLVQPARTSSAIDDLLSEVSTIYEVSNVSIRGQT